MTSPRIQRYIAFGILVKVSCLLVLKHYEGSSTHLELAYALVLLCLLIARPVKKYSSFF